MERRVWYAAYGSNLSSDRFRYYLEGGRPPGSARTSPGARDPSAPERTRTWKASGLLFFAKPQPVDGVDVWPGGVAFYDPDDVDSTTFMRLYLITAEQFVDVWKQELGIPISVPLAIPEVYDCEVVPDNQYGRIINLGLEEDCSIYTFTMPKDFLAELCRPSAAYLKTIVTGFMEAYGIPEELSYSYLENRLEGYPL